MADSVHSSSKRVFLSSGDEGQENIDLISDLPDSVICHILFFLPTKESFATCILSKRWKNLWTTVPVLSFTHNNLLVRKVRSRLRFEDFIDKVLAANPEQTIHQFFLDYRSRRKIDEVHLRSWINAVVGRNLQELRLLLLFPVAGFVRLPDNLFDCKTLVSLILDGQILLDVPLKVHLQSLKILRLYGVRAIDDSFSRMLSSCPVLEDLRLANVKIVNDSGMGQQHKVLINPSLLKSIYMHRTQKEIWEKFSLEDFPNLVEAGIEIALPDEHDFSRMFEALAKVESLLLSENIVRSCCLPSVKLPVFHNLICLEIWICCKNWNALVPLLEGADNLTTLVFHTDRQLYHSGCYCHQSPPKSVQKCVSTSLRTFKYIEFDNKECEWKLFRYILKHAKLLNQMEVRDAWNKQYGTRLKKLLKYPRASMTCAIDFFDHLGEPQVP